MLPYLQPKKVSSLLIAKRKPDGSHEVEGEAGEPNHALLSCAEDLISAVHAKDAQAVASAIEAAMDICSAPGMDSDEGDDQKLSSEG